MPLLILATLRAFWALRRDPQFGSLALLAAVAIISGTGFYTLVEGLRFVDAFYFSVITLTTVGYGDFAPQTDAGKLFTAMYVLFGVGILLAFVTTVAAKASQMRLRDDKVTPDADRERRTRPARLPDDSVRFVEAHHIVMTIFPRACPSPRYRRASGTWLSG